MDNKCKDCHHFTDEGGCRISGRSGRENPGYFADACEHFAPVGSVQLEPMKKKAPETHKTCKGCGRTLPVEEFVKHWRGGLTGYCKQCWSEKVCKKGGEEAAKNGVSGRPRKEKPAPARKKAETPKAPAAEPLRLHDISAAPLDALLQELNRRGYNYTITSR